MITYAVVTRFAPSPTGSCISAARAPRCSTGCTPANGGKFLLRIEDTDKARSTPEAIDAILDGMRWLGLDWDGARILPVAIRARHAEVAHGMLDRGHAYRCYMTPEELAAQRERRSATQAVPHRQPVARVDRRARRQAVRHPPEGAARRRNRHRGPGTGPGDGPEAEIDDFVLLRSDGTPTYMLAVVVDDHDMGVTHVIRGDDHLNNAFRQLAIIRAMGWPEPVYAHVPLIHGPDGAKL